MAGPLPAMPGSLPTMADSLPAMLDGIPANLIAEIRTLGLRSPPSDIQAVVARLCNIRPFTADDLAKILQRNKKWVKRSYLAPLIRDGILEYTIPDSHKHPNQAYLTKKQDEEKSGRGVAR
jgi:ATP-dependent DNA helicase RecG